MFSYYLKLALISLRKTPFLSLLMIMTIAIGIGAAMTTYTVSYLLQKIRSLQKVIACLMFD